MFTRQEAENEVLRKIDEEYGRERNALVLLQEHTVDKPYGWSFFFNTRAYVETGDVLESLGGNGPIVFERETGRIHQLGSANDPEDEIAEFEREPSWNV